MKNGALWNFPRYIRHNRDYCYARFTCAVFALDFYFLSETSSSVSVVFSVTLIAGWRYSSNYAVLIEPSGARLGFSEFFSPEADFVILEIC